MTTKTAHDAAATSAIPMAMMVDAVELAQIAPSGANPRTSFDEAALAELAASIARYGILEPLLVRRLDPPREGAVYELIAGERRLRAAGQAGVKTAPVRVLEVDAAEALKISLVENLQRADLDPLEEAAGYRRLHDELGMRQAQIAAAVGRSQPAIAKALGLLDLSEDVQARIRSGELTVSHGVALRQWKAFPAIASCIARLAADRKLTTAQIEGGEVLRWVAFDLQEAGLLTRVQTSVSFIATCKACPFGAYRAGEYQGWCLRPEHYAELEAAAHAARQARLDAAVAAARAEQPDATLLRLADLKYGEYEELHGYNTPAGCTGACPCRFRAVGMGGADATACSDPKRLGRLRGAETRKTKQENKLRQATALERMAQMLDTMPAGEGEGNVEEPQAQRHAYPHARELALVVGHVLATTYGKPQTRAAAARHTPELADNPCLVADGWSLGKQHDLGAWLDQLAAVAPARLLALAVEVVLRREIGDGQSSTPGARASSEPIPWTDWYTGTGIQTPLPTEMEEVHHRDDA